MLPTLRFLPMAALAAAALATAAPAAAAPITGAPHAYRAAQRGFHTNASWISTATQGLQLLKATDLGQVPGSTVLNVAVSLQLSNLSAAQSYLQHEYTPGDPSFRKFLTEQQFASAFGPTNSAVSGVVSYLQSSGFTSIAVEPNNLLVTASAPASAVMSAFNTNLHVFVVNGVTEYANITPAQVPSQLGSTVQSVLGLNNVAMDLFIHRSHQARAGRVHTDGAPPCQVQENGICILNSYTAAGFNTAYDTAGVPAATGTSVAVFTEGNVTQVPKDLRAYEAFNKLPQVPFTVRQVGLPSPDVAGLDEWDLDTQSSSAIAGNMKHLYLYNTSGLDDLSLTLDYNRFVHDQIAQIANASFGGCEIFNVEDGSLFVDDSIFLQAAVQGQTVFASSGDNGSGCPVAASTGAPSGLPFMSYPASSPYVVGVGGTTMLTNANNGSYYGEITWIGTGGGVSAIENSPFWQTPLFTKGGTRAVPDIAMDADPNTGADIIVNGAHLGVGGTSLSSPLSVGTYARLQTINHNRLGHAGPALYYSYYTAGGGNPPTPPPGAITQPIGGYHDIILGADGYYSALPGFDLTTGMGTFDVAKSAKLVK